MTKSSEDRNLYYQLKKQDQMFILIVYMDILFITINTPKESIGSKINCYDSSIWSTWD